MTAGNWGGSAAGSGFAFQAAVSAVCMVHMARGTSLGWCESVNDTPLSVSAESGGAGDDIALQLVDANVLEIQAKRKLKADSELWDSLMALYQRANGDATFHGVLVVGPPTSVSIRDQLARDIIRLGQGRTDDLSPLAVTLTEKLSDAGIPLATSGRVRIQTVHVLEQDSASAQAALAHLAHITTQPGQTWERLQAEGLRLIQLRGRHDVASIAGIIPGLRAIASGPQAPAIAANRLLEWTLRTTGTFAVPAVDWTFSLDDDWIELKAHSRDKTDLGLSSLEEALTRYHQGEARSTKRRQERDEFSAETLGYFVRQCVVVAGPGMGKTQLLRRIARLLARKKEPALLVRLRPLAERMRGGETFLEAALRIGLDASPLRPEEVLALGMQNLTFLLDGLDESGSEQEEIARAAAALAASSPGCRIVFATRPIGYETALLNTWRHYELVPIDSSDAKRGVERLVDAAGGDGNTRINEATAAATSHLDYNRDHRFHARSPLLIALLASLALNEVMAATTREGLYGQLFKLIERVAGAKRETTKATPAILNAFLQQLGWELVSHPYADAERTLSVCAKFLAAELGERPLKTRSICDEALAFWEVAGIVERIRFKASEALTFVHKTFGEYAATKYLLSRDASERTALLTAIEPKQQWNEVVVFASALGMGADLVNLALVRARGYASQIAQILRWAKHSRDPLPPALANTVLQQAWAVIAGPHSGHALNTGVDLVATLDKLPGAAEHSHTYRSHPQWWTELVGWACFVHYRPELLEFSGLLAFMDSYAERADTRKLSGGFDLHSPVHRLWEELLLPAAREAVRRGIGLEEQKFIDQLKDSLGARSMGFVSELTYILKDAGIDVKLPTDDLLSKYFSPEFFEQGRKDMLALLEAVCCDAPTVAGPAEPPLLHLSAFWYGTHLMSMGLSAAALAARVPRGGEAREIVALAARLSAYDYPQLIVEAQTKIQELKGADTLTRTFSGLSAVDAPLQWPGRLDSSLNGLPAKALLHPSKWIVYLAANLAEHYLSAADIAELVPNVLAHSEDLGMAAAADLAVEFLGKEKARELIVARLKQPLNGGCMYLFDYLARVWVSELDPQVDELLRPALLKGPRTAEAALVLVRACGEPHRKALAPLLKEAYDYWLKNEGPYPTEGGVIPKSPRGEILKLMIDADIASLDDLFIAAQDARFEVSDAATGALLTMLSSSETTRNELVQRIRAGQTLSKVLAACLRVRTSFSDSDVQSIMRLLESPRPENRHTAMGILQPAYLSPDEIKRWSEKLLRDPYQYIRDKAYERLMTL